MKEAIEDHFGGRTILFRSVIDREKYGLTERQANSQDMAEEYVVCEDDKANGGIIVYGKYDGKWISNPWSTRFLIRELLRDIEALKHIGQ